jgi:hypothetical protein
MANRRSKRQRINGESSAIRDDQSPAKVVDGLAINPLMAATSEEKLDWKGFCEIESEPVRCPAHIFGIGSY